MNATEFDGAERHALLAAVGAFLNGEVAPALPDKALAFRVRVAANLLRNRLFQLPAYKANAKAFGLEGAYVPWEVRA